MHHGAVAATDHVTGVEAPGEVQRDHSPAAPAARQPATRPARRSPPPRASIVGTEGHVKGDQHLGALLDRKTHRMRPPSVTFDRATPIAISSSRALSFGAMWSGGDTCLCRSAIRAPSTLEGRGPAAGARCRGPRVLIRVRSCPSASRTSIRIAPRRYRAITELRRLLVGGWRSSSPRVTHRFLLVALSRSVLGQLSLRETSRLVVL